MRRDARWVTAAEEIGAMPAERSTCGDEFLTAAVCID
jgi:hypothetical protein